MTKERERTTSGEKRDERKIDDIFEKYFLDKSVPFSARNRFWHWQDIRTAIQIQCE